MRFSKSVHDHNFVHKITVNGVFTILIAAAAGVYNFSQHQGSEQKEAAHFENLA